MVNVNEGLKFISLYKLLLKLFYEKIKKNLIFSFYIFYNSCMGKL